MAVQYKDYYEVLGVAKTAPQEEIRKAFRKLAREHHPDVAKDKKTSEAKFREINDAYEVLGDPEKRKKYDELGANWNSTAGRGGHAHPGWGGMKTPSGADYGNFNEFFEAFMGSNQPRGAGRRARSEETTRAQNVETEVHVSVEEVLRGVKKKITVRLPGRPAGEAVEVGVPAGMVPGHKVRIKGKGLHGGDLLCKAVLQPHAMYTVDGGDLLKTARIPVWIAVLGGTVEVRTPDGEIRLKVPAGTQPGKRFRLGGRGLPMSGKKRGDFILEIQVVVPEALSLEARACWVKLQELSEGL